ncbi:MAG: MFS transporter [Microbacteriaceae bacterium]|nr:MFS transporter [Microbacteriaceae bacterium]
MKLGKNYWSLLTSSSMSNLADGIAGVAMPLIAITLTREPVLIAGITVMIRLPWLFLALPVGAWIDRMDRRKVMLVANTFRGLLILFFSLLFLLNLANIWIFYVIAILWGVGELFYDTAAQSLMPQIVAKANLDKANSRLYTAEVAMNNFIGPPLGGFLVGLGVITGFATPGAIWLIAAGLLLLIKGNFKVKKTGPKATIYADVKEGIRYLFSNRVLTSLAFMTGISNLASTASGSIFVLFAVGPESVMGLTEVQFGALIITGGIGTLIGTVVAPWLTKTLGRQLTLAIGVCTTSLMAAIPFFSKEFWVLGGVFGLAGLMIMAWNVIVVTLRQRIVPAEMLGRINSSYRLIAWGTMPLGAILGGVIAQIFGLLPTFLITGIIALTPLLFLPFITNKAIDDAEAAAETD